MKTFDLLSLYFQAKHQPKKVYNTFFKLENAFEYSEEKKRNCDITAKFTWLEKDANTVNGKAKNRIVNNIIEAVMDRGVQTPPTKEGR